MRSRLALAWCACMWLHWVLLGLRNKREVYRVNYTLSKVRSVARHLLTLPEKVSSADRHC